MKRTFKILSFLLALLFAVTVFTACGDSTNTQTGESKDMITIQWVQGQKVLKEEVIEKGAKVQEWTPVVEGMEFQGWYERPYVKKFDFDKKLTKSTRIYAYFKSTGDEGSGEFEMPDWYLIGAGKGDLSKSNNWNHEASGKNLGLYAGEDGIYKITLNLYAGDQFKMTKDFAWDAEMAIDKMAGFADGKVKDAEGTVVFEAGENNNFVVAEGQDGKYEITFDPNTGLINFTLIERLDSMPDDIRLIGDNNGWGTVYGEEDFKFTTMDNVNWTYTWEVTSPVKFKVYNNSSGVYYPGGVDNDLHIDVEGTYTISFNSKTRVIVVTDASGKEIDVGFTSGGSTGGGEGGGSTVTPNANPVDKVYLVVNSTWNDGSIMGAWVWGAGDQWIVATPTEDPNVFEITLPAGTNMLVFADLNAGATELGDQWINKREQSSDLAVPDKSDDKIYYHVANATWSNSSEPVGGGSTGGNTPGSIPEGPGTLVFFQNNWKWTDVRCHYWGDGETAWPGESMILVAEVDGFEVYAIRVPANVSGIIFNGVKDDGSGALDQTPNIESGIVEGAGWKMEYSNGNTTAPFVYNPEGCSHTSTGAGTVVEAASCTTPGKISYVCDKCAETYVVNTPATGHNYGDNGVCTSCGVGSVYTVVGEAGLCGSAWATGDTANDMTFDSETGVYTKTFEGIAAGTYQYKVCRDHKWGAGEYPTNAANQTLNVSKDGATIVVTWNPKTQTLTAVEQ